MSTPSLSADLDEFGAVYPLESPALWSESGLLGIVRKAGLKFSSRRVQECRLGTNYFLSNRQCKLAGDAWRKKHAVKLL